MCSWRAFDLQWQTIPEDSHYIQLKISSTQRPHRSLEQLLNKLKKPIWKSADEYQGAKHFVRQMTMRTGSFTESFFKQKPPCLYVTSKYFSCGLTSTEEKCHILVNMTEKSPLYVYQCCRKEQHKYLDRCGHFQVLVNQSLIESDFTLHEVPMSRSYCVPPDSVYFFFTVSPSFFLLESIVPPFDIPVLETGAQSFPKTDSVIVSRKKKSISDIQAQEASEATESSNVHGDNALSTVSESESVLNLIPIEKIPSDEKELLLYLVQQKRKIFQAMNEERQVMLQYLHKMKSMHLTIEEAVENVKNEKDAELQSLRDTMQEENEYYEQLCAGKEKEILALKGEKEREIHSLKEEYESRIKKLTEKLDDEAKLILALEETNKNCTEHNEQLTLSLEALNDENSELRGKMAKAAESLFEFTSFMSSNKTSTSSSASNVQSQDPVNP